MIHLWYADVLSEHIMASVPLFSTWHTKFYLGFKGAWSRFFAKKYFANFFLLILMLTMLHEAIFNMQPNFKCHPLSYKVVTELTIF